MQTERRNSLRLLQWMMVASIALPFALFVFASTISYRSIKDTADRQIERTLDVAQEHALKVFETIDRSLSVVSEMIRDLPDPEIARREPVLHARLKQLSDSLPQLKSVWVFDPKGRALVNSLISPPPDIDFSDRDYFTFHVAEDRGVFIGAALIPRPPYQGAVFFGVSRRRPSADGRFAGVLQASVLPEYFEHFYARIGRDPGSFFALGLADGSVLARYPKFEGEAQIDRASPLANRIRQNPLGGLITEVSPLDGIERRIGYKRLEEYPIYVSAGLETTAIRAQWLSAMGQYLLFGLPATALIFLILSLAFRRTQRLYAESDKRQEAEEALKHSQRLEALGQLTGGVAHDFNNLLTVIRASVDLLKRPQLSEDRRQRYIDAISETVNRAAKLTAQLLAFARRQTLKPEIFDVGGCILSLSEMMQTLVGSPVQIISLVPDQPCFINADISQFETALINMTVNARDAMNNEGQLTIVVRPVAQIPGSSDRADLSHGFVAVSVEDSGVGIPQEQLSRIFEPFFTTKEVGQGTGLGLSQVFGFAKQSGGEVTVKSEIGKGSTFTLYLPRVAVTSAPHVAPAEEAISSDGGGMSVLLVEDNLEIGTFAVDALTGLGFKARLVESAAAAMSELTANAAAYDVVFSDVMMPNTTGIELAREIRQRFPDLPVVLSSGYSHLLSQNGSEGFEFLQKPYSTEQLARLLLRVGRRKKPKPQAAE